MLIKIKISSIQDEVVIIRVMKQKKQLDKKRIKRYTGCIRSPKKGYWHTGQLTKQDLYKRYQKYLKQINKLQLPVCLKNQNQVNQDMMIIKKKTMQTKNKKRKNR